MASKIKSNVVNIGVNPVIAVTLDNYIKNKQTIPISLFLQGSVSDAISSAISFMTVRKSGRVEIPASETVPYSVIVQVHLDKNSVPVDNFICNGYRYPLNSEARPYTGANWKIGDKIYNIDTTDQKCLGWVCCVAGTPGSWKRFANIRSWDSEIEVVNALPDASVLQLGREVLLNTDGLIYVCRYVNETYVWRCDTGDLTALTTTNKNTLVAAINELGEDTGDLASLVTEEKGSIVGALNEVHNDLNTTNSNLSNLSTDVSDLKGYLGYTSADVLGVEVDYVGKSFTRLAGAVGKSAGADFDSIKAFERKRCNLSDAGVVNAYYGDVGYTEDGSNGQVMVEQSKFYYRVVPINVEAISSGTGYHLRKARYYISDTPKIGFKVHPAFVVDGVERDKIYLSAYEGSLFDVTPPTAEVDTLSVTHGASASGNVSITLDGGTAVNVAVVQEVAEVASLSVTGAPTSSGNISVGLNGVGTDIAVVAGTAEVATLTVTAIPTANGNITVTLNDVGTTTALTTTMTTTDLVAAAIAGTTYSGWTTSVTGSVVTFTASAVGVKSDISFTDTGTTGATATVAVTAQGVDADTTTTVATKIRNTSFSGWTTGGSATTVTFTCNTMGARTDSTFSAGTTGSVATMTTTTQGVDGDATNVATRIRNATYTGWTTGGAGTDVTFTCNTTGPRFSPTFAVASTGVVGSFEQTTLGAGGYVSRDNQVADFTASTGDKLCSIVGTKPISGTTQLLSRTNTRNLAVNRGSGWRQQNITSVSLSQLLFMIEYASLNTQLVIGKGVTEATGVVSTGATSSLGNATGVATGTDGLVSASYRGEENPWGNIWKWVDGVNIEGSSKNIAYWADNGFTDDVKTAPYKTCGFTIAKGNGYISSFGYSDMCDFMFIPSETLGASNLPVGDGLVQDNTHAGFLGNILGGLYNSSSDAGLFYSDVSVLSSVYRSDISGRLLFVGA